MRRYPVLLLEGAFTDLDDIAAFITEGGGSEATALRFVDRIEQRCDKIGDAPEGYPLKPDLGPGIRTVPFEHSAVIVYRVEDETVQILRVLYGGRDYAALV